MRRRPKPPPRVEKRTLVPPYDPVDLARAIEVAAGRPTTPPPFDPAAYARIVDARVKDAADKRDTPKTMTAAAPIPETNDVEAIARAMYSSYLESDFPEALVLAEHVVQKEPDHALAHAVVSRCRAVLGEPTGRTLAPSSVLRLRANPSAIEALPVDRRSMVVLRHLDGVSDAATVADLAGISRVEALEHLHALLDAGVVELVA